MSYSRDLERALRMSRNIVPKGIIFRGSGGSTGGLPPPAHIIVLLGQSNALGQTGNPVLAGLPADYLGEQSRIQIWWEGNYQTYPEAGHWENMYPVVNTRNHIYTDPAGPYYNIVGWSVEQRCSHYLPKPGGRPIYVAKEAVGAEDIDNWEKPTGDRWIAVERYITDIVAYFTAIKVTPIFLSTCWMQGESDCDDGKYQLYEGKFNTFLTNYRAISPYLTNSQFVMIKLRTDWNYGDPGGITAVNQAFQNAADANPTINKVITPENVGGTASGGHYNANGLLNLGEAWYDLI